MKQVTLLGARVNGVPTAVTIPTSSGSELQATGVKVGVYMGYDKKTSAGTYDDHRILFFGRDAKKALELSEGEYIDVTAIEEGTGAERMLQAKIARFPYKKKESTNTDSGSKW